MAWEGTPALHGTFMNKGVIILRHLLDLAGLNLDNAEALARRLGIQSVKDGRSCAGQVQKGAVG